VRCVYRSATRAHGYRVTTPGHSARGFKLGQCRRILPHASWLPLIGAGTRRMPTIPLSPKTKRGSLDNCPALRLWYAAARPPHCGRRKRQLPNGSAERSDSVELSSSVSGPNGDSRSEPKGDSLSEPSGGSLSEPRPLSRSDPRPL